LSLTLTEEQGLRPILGPMREERTEKKMHNGKLHNFYSLTNIITMIKSSKMRWVGHEANMEDKSLQQFFRKV
jgi:hypothetical protein